MLHAPFLLVSYGEDDTSDTISESYYEITFLRVIIYILDIHIVLHTVYVCVRVIEDEISFRVYLLGPMNILFREHLYPSNNAE